MMEVTFKTWRAAYYDPEHAASEAFDLAAMRWKENQRLTAALAELVKLKALKDRIENHHALTFHEARRIPEMEADYARRKPLAWQAARDALVPNAKVSEGER